jgi:glucokinase
LIVEQECSGWAVDRKIREAVKERPDSRLAQLIGNSSSNEAEFLGDALKAKCPLAQSILKETSQSLAFALSHVTHLFHPEAIILGGGLSLLGQPLLKGVALEFSQYLMEALKPGPVISLAELREDVVPVGALLMAGAAFLCAD